MKVWTETVEAKRYMSAYHSTAWHWSAGSPRLHQVADVSFLENTRLLGHLRRPEGLIVELPSGSTARPAERLSRRLELRLGDGGNRLSLDSASVRPASTRCRVSRRRAVSTSWDPVRSARQGRQPPAPSVRGAETSSGVDAGLEAKAADDDLAGEVGVALDVLVSQWVGAGPAVWLRGEEGEGAAAPWAMSKCRVLSAMGRIRPSAVRWSTSPHRSRWMSSCCISTHRSRGVGSRAGPQSHYRAR